MPLDQEMQASDAIEDTNSSHFCVESWKRLFSKPDLLQTGCNEGYSQWKDRQDMKNGIQYQESCNNSNANCNDKKNRLHNSAHTHDETKPVGG